MKTVSKNRRPSKTRIKTGLRNKSKSGLINKEINKIKLIERRGKIKSKIKSTLISGNLNLAKVGSSGGALSSLQLNKISDRDKRRLLGRLVAAAGRKRM